MNITYVSFVAGKIFVSNVQQKFIKPLKDLGGQGEEQDSTKFIIKYSDESEKIKLFTALRNLGIAFSAGKDWSPSEQFEDLRERGLIQGKYLRIEWSGPDKYRVDER